MAAAIAVNIADSESTATVPDGLVVSADGALTVSAANTTAASATASGTSSGTAKVGVGAAVAINLAKARSLGMVGAGTTITAQALTVQGENNGCGQHLRGLGDCRGRLLQGRRRGGRGHQPRLRRRPGHRRPEHRLAAGHAGRHGHHHRGRLGAVGLTAEDDSTSTASALPSTSDGASGSSVGVGVALALDIVTNTSTAEIANNVSLAGAGAVSLSAESNDAMTTTATTGAASTGGTAVERGRRYFAGLEHHDGRGRGQRHHAGPADPDPGLAVGHRDTHRLDR